MAWTAPRTWTTSETVTAAIMNAHVRDNLLETGPAKVTTAGDLLYATGANALARLGIGSALQVLKGGASAPSWGNVPFKVRKTSDETVNNSAALQNDDDLLMALAANEVWAFEAYLIYTTPATPDIKFAFTVPAGATLQWGTVAYDSAGVLVQVDVSASGTSKDFVDGTSYSIFIQGVVLNGANAGNLQLQWAQNTMNASNTKVLTGSYLIGHQLA